ncbi:MULTISPECIES: hypothetical protein [Pseudomonas]|nr:MULTISPECIES: hypothetical protein [Pseudomonas]PJH85772.1 hypothetical protein CVG87_28380 [Pseudomonas sp. WCS365]UII13837.1 hypothetical protein LRP86_00701 [Pseudomonas brassicacearum]UVM43301.1 hypothetical protein LOY47_22795 [Pseudomonas brassicacearum]WLG66830.1 hypothetical protein PSH71_22930 [Pseudomonas brassicacearum]
MRGDNDIYNDIGAILFDVAPKGACKVVMRAQLAPELDSCEHEYDFVDEQGNVSWFTAGGRVNTDMLKLLVELRHWYFQNKLTAGMSAWSGCEVMIDLVERKVGVEFIYLQ